MKKLHKFIRFMRYKILYNISIKIKSIDYAKLSNSNKNLKTILNFYFNYFR